jgi:enoyl-CoA hydratase/3-hydroxypropionyl-coenzyme A dehydratase
VTVLLELLRGVARVTLNRPEVLNALNLQMRDDLWALLDVLELDQEVRVVVFNGAGTAFCSGADLNDFGTAPSFIEARRGRIERDLWGRLAHLDKPLIAAVHGYALGAGLELALLCDFRIAATDARLGLPETGLGYLPTAGGSQTLPRVIGPGHALDLILTGDPVSAGRALELDLVHTVVPRDELSATAEVLAARLASFSPPAVRAAKRALVEGTDLALALGLRLEAVLGARLSGSR